MQIIDHSGRTFTLGLQRIFFTMLKFVTLGKMETINEKYKSAKKEFEEERNKI